MKNKILYKNKPYLIADCAYSHEGDLDYLRKSIKKIAETKCVDAVKFHVLFDIQTYISPSHDLYEKYQDWLFDENEWRSMIDYARNLNLDVIVLADDMGCLNFLESIQDKLSAIEIHACSLNDIIMLDRITNFNIPVILGVGGSTIDEISFAIDRLGKISKSNIILMYGFQSYPTRYIDINLSKILKIKKLFDLPVGYADHTAFDDPNNEIISVMAAMMGINILEKHFTPDYGKKRIDYHAAIGKEQMLRINKLMKLILTIYGTGELKMSKAELEYGSIGPIKKAIVAKKFIEKDEKLSLDNICFKRTGEISSIKQNQILELIGLETIQSIRKDEVIDFTKVKYQSKKVDSGAFGIVEKNSGE